ncbi:MAG: hypothetical protein AAGA37_09710 [Actinomycetota bacterium]
MRRRGIVGFVAALAVGCGTGGTDIEFTEPTPTLFSDDADVETTLPPTTVGSPAGLATLDRRDLPSPRPAPGVVIIDGIAAPVLNANDTSWTIETPCGTARTETGTEVEHALVVIDPAGDARTADGATEVERNAALSTTIADRLQAAGIATVITRQGAVDLAASYRREAGVSAGALVVVTVSVVDGVGALTADPSLEVVYPAIDEPSQRLAGLLYADVVSAIDLFSVGWPDDLDSGVRSVLNQRGDDFFTVLQEPSTSARAVVHLPVDPDAASVMWTGGTNRAPLADAIANAIVRWLVTDAEGSGFVTPAHEVRQAEVSSAGPCIDPLAVEVGD